MPILLGTGIIDPALRIAGITNLPGTTPSIDQRGELIPVCNRLLDSWSCNGHLIFTTGSAAYPLSSGQKVYSIGPGGDINAPRPLYITDANFLFPTSPVVRRPIRIVNQHEYSRIAVQEISGAPPWVLYYDYAYNGSGLGSISITPQPPPGYSLELYTWQGLSPTFVAVTDVVLFPPGYERALVTNLALEAATYYPKESTLHAQAPVNARAALSALLILNSKSPHMRSEASRLGGHGRAGGDVTSIITGGGGSGGGATTIIYFVITGTPTGTNGSDGNAVFTLSPQPNSAVIDVGGLVQTPNVSYTLSGSTVTFLAPNIPLAGARITAFGT